MKKIVSLIGIMSSMLNKAKEIFLDIWENVGAEEDAQGMGDGLLSQQTQARIFIVVALAALGLLFLYLLVTFIRAPWKEKVWRLVTLAIAVGVLAAIVAAALYF